MEKFTPALEPNIIENERQDLYFIEKSFIDQENKCIHVPVKMPKIKGVPDVNIEIIDNIMLELQNKFKDENLTFTGEWGTPPNEGGIEEYLFFYE